MISDWAHFIRPGQGSPRPPRPARIPPGGGQCKQPEMLHERGLPGTRGAHEATNSPREP